MLAQDLGLFTSASLALEGSARGRRKKEHQHRYSLTSIKPCFLQQEVKGLRYSSLAHLGLLGGLDDDAVGGVVEFPGNDT